MKKRKFFAGAVCAAVIVSFAGMAAGTAADKIFGTVNAAGLSEVLAASGTEEETTSLGLPGDVNGNAVVDETDLNLIQKYLVDGLTEEELGTFQASLAVIGKRDSSEAGTEEQCSVVDVVRFKRYLASAVTEDTGTKQYVAGSNASSASAAISDAKANPYWSQKAVTLGMDETEKDLVAASDGSGKMVIDASDSSGGSSESSSEDGSDAAYLSADGAAATSGDHDLLYVYTAPCKVKVNVAVEVSVNGSGSESSSTGSSEESTSEDGVVVYCYRNSTENCLRLTDESKTVYDEMVVLTSDGPTTLTAEDVILDAGDKLYFRYNKNGTADNDEGIFHVAVTYTELCPFEDATEGESYGTTNIATNSVVKVGLSDGTYANYFALENAADALLNGTVEASSDNTIYVLQDVTMDSGISISGKSVTITNWKNPVRIIRGNGLTGAMFTVESDAGLTIGTAGSTSDTAETIAMPPITVDGNNVGATAAMIVVENKGSFVLKANGGLFNGNNTSGSGGALNLTNATVTLAGTVSNNKASSSGGAVYMSSGGSLTVNGGTYYGNSAENGGTIYQASGKVTVNGGIFTENTCSTSGGVFCCKDGTLEIAKGSFYNNENSGGYGGVIHCSGTLTVTGGNYYRNCAVKGGGVVYINTSSANISNAIMYENRVTGTVASSYGFGGAIYIYNNGKLTLTGCNIHDNASDYVSEYYPGCDISIGQPTNKEVMLYLNDNVNVGIIQQRWSNTNAKTSVATIMVQQKYAGKQKIVVIPFRNASLKVYNSTVPLVSFSDGVLDDNQTGPVSWITVRWVNGESSFDDTTYYVDSSGKIQKNEASE